MNPRASWREERKGEAAHRGDEVKSFILSIGRFVSGIEAVVLHPSSHCDGHHVTHRDERCPGRLISA